MGPCRITASIPFVQSNSWRGLLYQYYFLLFLFLGVGSEGIEERRDEEEEEGAEAVCSSLQLEFKKDDQRHESFAFGIGFGPLKMSMAARSIVYK